jgi:hypothetical protein
MTQGAGPPADSPTLAEFLLELGKQLAAIEADRQAKLAAMTPAERQRLAQAEAERANAAQRLSALRKLEKQKTAVMRAAAPLCGHATTTLIEFACVSHGVSPRHFESINYLNAWATDRDGIEKTLKTLVSYVREFSTPVPELPLYPVNPNAPPSKQRFLITQLVSLAVAKRFRGNEFIAEALGTKPVHFSNAGQSISTPPGVGRLRTVPAEQVPKPDRTPWRSLLKEVLDAMIEECVALTKSCVRRNALPFRHQDVRDRLKKLCATRGIDMPEETSTRQHINKLGFEFKKGNRNKQDREIIRHLQQL